MSRSTFCNMLFRIRHSFETAMSDDKLATAVWTETGRMRPTKPNYERLDFTQSKHFDSTDNAIRYVMESLPEVDRSSASIHSDRGLMTFAEIEVRYHQLKRP